MAPQIKKQSNSESILCLSDIKADYEFTIIKEQDNSKGLNSSAEKNNPQK